MKQGVFEDLEKQLSFENLLMLQIMNVDTAADQPLMEVICINRLLYYDAVTEQKRTSN